MQKTLAIILLSALPGLAMGVPVLDQQSLPIGETTGLNGHYTVTWQQQVRAGLSGQLVGIDVWMYPGEGRFFVNPGPAYQPRWLVNDFAFSEELDFVGTPGVPDWFYLDVSDAAIWLDAGEAFIFGMRGTLGGRSLYPLAVRSNPYAAGSLYSQTSAAFGGDADFGFRTYVDATVVSEPALWSLLLGGLGICAGMRRRA